MIYWVGRACIRFLLRLLARWEVIGLEHVPPHGPYIIITNHLSYLDPPVVMALMPSRVTVLVADKYRRHPFGLLIRLVDPIWIRRGEPDRQALRDCMRLLEGGGVLGLAPEGTRSKTGGLQQGKTGAAFVAVKTNALIVPAVVSGTERALSDLARFRRPHIRCAIGEPFRLEMPAGHGEHRLDTLTEEMMLRMAAVLPPEYRGVYAGRPGAPAAAPQTANTRL